jgi:hypothetical protein
VLSVWLLLIIPLSMAIASEKTADGLHSLPIRRIALMPFLKGQFTSPKGEEDKPLSYVSSSRTAFDPRNLRDDADEVLTRMVSDTLETRFKGQWIPSEQTRTLFDRISKEHDYETPRDLAKALGEELNAELVVIGSVWRYRERGAIEDMPDAAPSVAFEVYLMEVSTARRLWRSKFEETQKTLSEDVIRGLKQWKMGARWLSADELARYGVWEVFKTFPISTRQADGSPTR